MVNELNIENLDGNLALGKTLILLGMIIVVLQEDNKYYPQVCLHECVHEYVNKL